MDVPPSMAPSRYVRQQQQSYTIGHDFIEMLLATAQQTKSKATAPAKTFG